MSFCIVPTLCVREHDDERKRYRAYADFACTAWSDRAACDAAGNELAQMLQKSIAESGNSPQVTVSYSPCRVPAHITRNDSN